VEAAAGRGIAANGPRSATSARVMPVIRREIPDYAGNQASKLLDASRRRLVTPGCGTYSSVGYSISNPGQGDSWLEPKPKRPMLVVGEPQRQLLCAVKRLGSG
jgi:hypothetical protein